MKLRTIIGIILITLTTGLFADTLQLRSDHPQKYTVVKGDTLWDISSKFLEDPWKWPEIWEKNPQIDNPDLIYPGDTINLIYVDGQPRLTLTRGKGQRSGGDGKLSPQIREISLDQAIQVIPLNVIRQFLTKPKIVGPREIETAPYIVDFADEHVIGGAGDRIYVRSIDSSTADGYTVFRNGDTFRDAETDEILGYEAQYIAETQLQRTGDPATLLLTRTDLEVRIGDRLLPIEQEKLDFRFIPRAPDTKIAGHIIAVVEGVSQIGQYDVVVIDRGTKDGLEIGHVLDIFKSGREVRDVVSENPGETVFLPEEKAGRLMIFRPFERVSYALVVGANYALHINDAVRSH